MLFLLHHVLHYNIFDQGIIRKEEVLVGLLSYSFDAATGKCNQKYSRTELITFILVSVSKASST